jgi:hypothetical protein
MQVGVTGRPYMCVRLCMLVLMYVYKYRTIYKCYADKAYRRQYASAILLRIKS